MNVAMNIDTTNYLIIGAGVTGLSVVEYLLSQNKSMRIMDSRELPPNAANIEKLLPSHEISFGDLNKQWLSEADVLVLSPGMSPKDTTILNSINKNAEIIGDIELFARDANKPYIAVTGSNGKSTVTTLVTDILVSQGIHAKAGANIGEPALTLLNDSTVDVCVLELSSFQLETCSSIQPISAVVLNVSDDHLDRHQSIDEYAKIKASIYTNARKKIVRREGNEILLDEDNVISFGLDAPLENHFGISEQGDDRWLAKGSLKLMKASDIQLMGETGELNVLAALALTDNYIHDYEKAISAIKAFAGLPHRCQLFLDHKGVKWIDDSKGTNIGATVSAIQSIDTPIVLILGGTHKGGSLGELKNALQPNVRHVITFGQDKKIFSDALQSIIDVSEFSSLSDVVTHASELAADGDTVLFSPACASFDMFSNYIQRGLEFQSQVKRYVQGVENGCR